MLQYYGFVRQNPESKAYVPGPVLIRIGVASLQGMDLRKQVRPFLEQLSRDADETVHLVVREGQQVLFLDGSRAEGGPGRVSYRCLHVGSLHVGR
ncbi:hypothetical protein [Pseudonocardia sp. WMMC193]|uniref:IclR family transcriptional regulator domain-containing protein n=1 Tax=Pseudonocardia sp. WMMC193 TaxID=2911965 RepID=UPI001F2618D6|nr:hypothetical protein [Pseudonocardia sp. WMMC193]MCF7552241.1 hypothetical protein [Pseudonocardia sp. WMMC193]